MAKSKSKLPVVLVLVLVLGALLVGAEIGSKAYVTSQLQARFAKAMPGERAPDVTIDSFPFLAKYLASGSVGDVALVGHGVSVAGLKIAKLTIDLRDVEVSGSPLEPNSIKLERVAKTTLTAEVGRSEIARLTGAEVVFKDGAVQLSRFGFSVTAQVKADKNGKVRLSSPPLPDVELALPAGLFSCTSTAVSVEQDAVRLRCERDKPPVELLGVIAATAK